MVCTSSRCRNNRPGSREPVFAAGTTIDRDIVRSLMQGSSRNTLSVGLLISSRRKP